MRKVDLREAGDDDEIELNEDEDVAHEIEQNHLYPALAYKVSKKCDAANKGQVKIETTMNLSKAHDKKVFPGLFYQAQPTAKI